MSKRLTKDISRYQSYCQFELKDCRYKDIYNFEHYSELEECVDCDLTLGIDKLGEYENIDTDPKHLAKIKQALEIISKKGIFVNGLIKSKDLEEYNILCLNHGMTELLTQEEYDLLKEVLL